MSGDGLCCVGEVGTTERGVLPGVPRCPPLTGFDGIHHPPLTGFDGSWYKQMAVACQHLVQPQGEQGQSGHQMNLPWNLCLAARNGAGPQQRGVRWEPARPAPSPEASASVMESNFRDISQLLPRRPVRYMLDLGLPTDGEVGSPAGLERGFQRVRVFRRARLQSANRAAQAGKGNTGPGGGTGCFLIKEPPRLGSDGVVCK